MTGVKTVTDITDHENHPAGAESVESGGRRFQIRTVPGVDNQVPALTGKGCCQLIPESA
jgi:hypothetical protein